MTVRHHSPRVAGHSRRAFLTRAATLAGGAALSLGLLPACAQQPQAPAPKPAAPAPTTPPAPAAAAPAAKAPEKPAPAAPAASAPAAKVAAESKPKSGGKLTAVTEANWVDLEPHKNALFASTQAYDHVYESLTEYDKDLKAAPALAESWETPDPQTQIFKLRQGVTWHDGSTLTADDVKYSFERVRAADTASPWRDSLGSVDKIEVVDPRTVKITHTRPNAFFLETLASLRGTAIIKNGSAEKLDLKREAIGTGPFKVAEIKSGDFIRFGRHAAYWGKPRPYVDELTLKLMVEEDTRVAWLRAGQVDYIDLYAEGAQRLEGDASAVVVKAPKVYMMGISFNVREKPLSDGRVRRALDMAVDRQASIDKARFGAAELTGFVPSGFGEWSLPESKLPAYYARPDLEGAKKLLAEAGYPNGFEIEIKGSRPEHMAIAIVAKDSWKRIGVEAKVLQQEYGTYISDNTKGLFQALVIGNTFVPNPVDYLSTKFHTKGSGNRYGYSNTKLDAVIEEAQRATDRPKIKQLLEDGQRLLWEDGAPYLYLYNALNLEGLRSAVKGYTPSYTARRTALRDAFLDS